VFGIAPELIKQPSDLLRVLLRRHYGGQRIPAILDERFIQVLRQNGLFEDWPLEAIIPDAQAFFAFLQERWPVFLDSLQSRRTMPSTRTRRPGWDCSGNPHQRRFRPLGDVPLFKKIIVYNGLGDILAVESGYEEGCKWGAIL